ncbi:MAG TPA: hypothetical protein VFB73_19855 [Chloroflexota bacterium]|nr:hypothetical protein [Chloroflexota bacterium]
MRPYAWRDPSISAAPAREAPAPPRERVRFTDSTTARVIVEQFALEPGLAAEAYDRVISAFTRDGGLSRSGIETLLLVAQEAEAVAAGARFETSRPWTRGGRASVSEARAMNRYSAGF